jgi:hypothetical protein
VLFRIEAITFLIGMPFILLKQNEFNIKQRVKHFFQVDFIPVFALLLITGALIIVRSVHLSDFGRLQEAVVIFPRLLADISLSFHIKANIMNEMVLGNFFDDYGMMGLIISLMSITIFKVISLIGWPVAGIFALSHSNRSHNQTMQNDARHILHWACALALLNACMIIASAFILSGRYIIALAFILLIFAAFRFASLVEKIRSNQINKRWQKMLFFALVALIALFAIKNILPKRAGYNFEQDAVAYLKQQQIPNSKVFFVTPRSRYFAGAPYAGRGYDYWDFTQKAIADGSISQYDYLAINLDIDEKYAARKKILDEKLPQFKVAKEFLGLRGKKEILLYVKK